MTLRNFGDKVSKEAGNRILYAPALEEGSRNATEPGIIHYDVVISMDFAEDRVILVQGCDGLLSRAVW